MNLSTPEWFLPVTAGLLQLAVIAAVWLALLRIRRWKEQILHSVAVLESNSHEGRTDSVRRNALTVEQTLTRELAAIRDDLGALRARGDLRELVSGHAGWTQPEEITAPNTRYAECVEFLESLDHAAQASREYLAIHLHRTARTLAMAPRPVGTGRALELGAYLYMASALGPLLEYREVRGAYLGTPGQPVRRASSSRGKVIFECDIDLFNAEKDTFPYPDGHFDLVLACEIFEHLAHDPMFMLMECARVLTDGGALLVTTPNVVSHTSVARALTAARNPQVYSKYSWAETESPHVREYTPGELREAVTAAGFRVEYLFTEKIEGCDDDAWVPELLKQLGLPGTLRGEQIYCLARKQADAGTVRYPEFLYERPPGA